MEHRLTTWGGRAWRGPGRGHDRRRPDPGGIVGDALSPDGRVLALLVSTGDLHLQVIDLQSGNVQTVVSLPARAGGFLASEHG